MFLTFYQPNNKKYSRQFTASSVSLIPKWMGIPRTEYPSWACPYSIPDGHVIVEADYSRGKEDGSHLVIPCLYHLENFPKLINIGWGVSVSEPNFKSDGVKAALRYGLTKAIGACICLLIKGGDTTKIVPLTSMSGVH